MSNLPVPAPRNFGVSEVETAAYMNAVRDALNFLLNVPAAFLTQATVQSIANSTWTAITLDQSVFDSYGAHSNTTNPSRYTAQVAGWYMIFGCVSFAVSATGNRGTSAAKNATRVQGAAGFVGAIASNALTVPSPPCIVFLNVGDYAEIYGYQTSGAALSTNSSADLDSSMTAVWLHT